VSPATGLLSPYLSLVNAALHIASAIRQRRYNPGLWTAIFLFVPLGIYTIIAFSAVPEVTPIAHVAGLMVAILLHAGTFVYMRRNVAAPAS
jgi:hypothetical protein